MTSANGKALVHNVHLVGRPLFYPKMLLLWRKIDFPNLLSSNSRNLPIKSLFKKIEIFLTWAANNIIGIWILVEYGIRFGKKIDLMITLSLFQFQSPEFTLRVLRDSSVIRCPRLYSMILNLHCFGQIHAHITFYNSSFTEASPCSPNRKSGFFSVPTRVQDFRVHCSSFIRKACMLLNMYIFVPFFIRRPVHTFEWTF